MEKEKVGKERPTHPLLLDETVVEREIGFGGSSPVPVKERKEENLFKGAGERVSHPVVERISMGHLQIRIRLPVRIPIVRRLELTGMAGILSRMRWSSGKVMKRRISMNLTIRKR